MSRKINYDFMCMVLKYFKFKWLQNNKKPIQLSIREITEELKEKNSNIEIDNNKVWFYINVLKRRLNINILEGKGASANTYEFLNEEGIQDQVELNEEEIIEEVQDITTKMNNITAQVIESYSILSKQYLDSAGTNAYYKELLSELDFMGDLDGYPIFKAKKDSNILTIIQQLKIGLADDKMSSSN